MTSKDDLTIFHVTHWKAGSQWVYKVLEDCAPDRIVKPRVKIAHFYVDAIQPGKIYPTVYVPRDRFFETLMPKIGPEDATHPPALDAPPSVQNWYNFQAKNQPIRIFFVIRDLRDSLISLYFSLKVSHPLITDQVAEGRRKLNEVGNEEEGMLFLINERGRASANIQRSWLSAYQSGELMLVRYEDLIANEQQEFAKIIEYCQMDIPAKKLTGIVNNNSFNKRAGRKPGEEDISSHYRKGVSGDWKNHFTDRIKTEFKQKFGQLLIDTGYEKDMNW